MFANLTEFRRFTTFYFSVFFKVQIVTCRTVPTKPESFADMVDF
uniref:Uncharacterized protein n=1 Tax=Siphoviridae sp. ctGa111 TaxID=2825413 RepID=A0A8S5VDG6_9CAUD|nr:MAG TPA: hypothetical protein [Siphoviridae sp. ctGa111]